MRKKAKNSTNNYFSFKLYSALIAFIISLSTLLFDYYLFFKTTFFLGLALGTWFFIDYKMLQVNKYYNCCLLISVVFSSYCIFIAQYFASFSLNLVLLGTFHPVSFLIIQKPLRIIFIKLAQREPVIDRPIPSLPDGIYTILLFFAFTILPFIVMDYINSKM